MKNTLKIIALLFLLMNYTKHKQLVQTTKDVYQLKMNNQQSVNKPWGNQ
jgi:hypothetical protein